MAAFATSYIPTTTAAATRAADAASMIGANFSNWYNAVEGSLFGECSVSSLSNLGSRAIFDVSDGSTNNRMIVRPVSLSQNTATAVIRSGGVGQAGIASTNLSTLSLMKLALGYKVNDFSFTLNSGAVSTASSGLVPVSANQLILGAGTGSSEFLNGHIRRIAAFPRRLANAELTALTS